MAWIEGMRRTAARWAGDGVDLLFPAVCLLCQREAGLPCPTGTPPDGFLDQRAVSASLCEACRRCLEADSPRCRRCGEPAAPVAGCRACRGRRQSCQGLSVVGGYGDQLRCAVLRAKHPAGDGISRMLAELWVHKHHATLSEWGIDLIVPVPMHWLRRAVRGTSAADELARAIACFTGLPRRSALRRVRATVMQNQLPVSQRTGNVAAAFRCRQPLGGKTVLLVDDVVTTGATLEACGRALLDAGAGGVFAAAAAKADRSSPCIDA